MADGDGILLTTEQVSRKADRKRELEGRIKKDQAELAEVTEWLKAAHVILGDAIIREIGESISTTVQKSEEAGEETVFSLGSPQETMMDAVDRIVASAKDSIVSKKEVRRVLAKEGFEPVRLGNYFYTVIARLKERGRIVVLDTGTLSRGPRSEYPKRQQRP